MQANAGGTLRQILGGLSQNSKVPLLLIGWLVAIANDRVFELCRAEIIVSAKPPSMLCQSCGGILVCEEIWLPGGSRVRIRPPPTRPVAEIPPQEAMHNREWKSVGDSSKPVSSSRALVARGGRDFRQFACSESPLGPVRSNFDPMASRICCERFSIAVFAEADRALVAN